MWQRGLCEGQSYWRAKPSASVRQAGGRSLKSEYSKVMAVVAPWGPVMLPKILSLRGGGYETDTV